MSTHQINPHAGAQPVIGLDAYVSTDGGTPPDTSELSPDALMVYCQTRLHGLDTQMKAFFAGQQKANADSAAINDALGVLNKYSDGFMDGGGGDPAKAQELDLALQTAIGKVGRDTPVGQKLVTVYNRVHETGAGGDNRISRDEMQGFLSDLKSVQSEISANSELGMIQLQSLMSQRTTALQLVTNLVQSLGDQANKIAANVGH